MTTSRVRKLSTGKKVSTGTRIQLAGRHPLEDGLKVG